MGEEMTKKPMPDWAKAYDALTPQGRGPSLDNILRSTRPNEIGQGLLREWVEDYAILKRDGDDAAAEAVMGHILRLGEEETE